MFAMHDDSSMLLGTMFWLLVGIIVVLIARAIPVTDRPLSRGFWKGLFTVVGWTIILTAFILFFWVGGLLFILVAAIYLRRRRAGQQALLWNLAVAAERGIPLLSAIEAFADEHWGLTRWNARALIRMIKAGTPLPDALKIAGGMVPTEAMVPIQVGDNLGSLSAGLRQATAPAGLQQMVWDQLTGRLAYLSFITLWAIGVLTFIMIKIVPAFQKIFDDFGAELPDLTKVTIGVARAVCEFWWSLPLLLFFLFIYAIIRYLGLVSWDLPLMARVMRPLYSATILESLALAAERNQPFTKTMGVLARYFPKWPIRWRLQAALADVTTGVDWAESLQAYKLISPSDQAVLQAAGRVGNLPWALREVAETKRRRMAYRIHAWVQILFPAAIIGFGIVVGSFVAGCFIPLIALIQKLS